mmetsp:Transcript_12897/g.28500  ORF Transcript_12897/g.28500 Transcript_12897/m.28500 type:complete len:247 (-) Transcript_12897:83-823(-)|eukprot:CAMPEP_0113304688 /NCGR_PEP_ID=MMETSP0010_2-20120614/4606_1 /TAXON_ID=216773 ORGANISM="Corethron hystrix, Strain 308" /NCGR_SAMPLE_ID=MMETSP0010_2 /ASSEMBLY_ACC=CAM_ASM_000155 /LENGTH=246 /DNA_ID=CAMNT_0000158939 /DNA_START=339 /DNA_END=1079 /DNA_ORIENTATION=- /assembly_acc=CAM_ASM_000155
MAVDALTYGFNLWAERQKANYADGDDEIRLDPKIQFRNRRCLLLLELIPPLFSVTTLIVVTVGIVQESWNTLSSKNPSEEEPLAGVMLVFSIANLLLDFLNVGCFARAGYGFGTRVEYSGSFAIPLIDDEEKEGVKQGGLMESADGIIESSLSGKENKGNLNICSAYTHIFADTLRSIAVIVAALLVICLNLDGTKADAISALVVSAIIVFSIFPLLRGIVGTLKQLTELRSSNSFQNTSSTERLD